MWPNYQFEHSSACNAQAQIAQIISFYAFPSPIWTGIHQLAWSWGKLMSGWIERLQVTLEHHEAEGAQILSVFFVMYIFVLDFISVADIDFDLPHNMTVVVIVVNQISQRLHMILFEIMSTIILTFPDAILFVVQCHSEQHTKTHGVPKKDLWT